MEAEIETKVQKRSHDSAFNPQTQTLPHQNNNLTMTENNNRNSNSQALIVVPSDQNNNPTMTNDNNSSNSQAALNNVVPPDQNHAEKPKKQRRARAPKPPTQTYDEAGCGTSADRTMLWRLVHFLQTDMKYNDIRDVKIISEKKLTDSDVNAQQARLDFQRTRVRTPFLEDSEIQHQKNYVVPVKVIMGDHIYDMHLTRWDSKDDNNNNNEQPRWKYVLKKGWKKVLEQNNLQSGDWIQLVSFWSNNQLHLAIVKYEYIVLGNQELGEYVVYRN